MKLVVAANAAVDALPFTVLAPVQPPEAEQLVEFVEAQVSTDVAPLAMVVGLAVSVTVGAAVMATLAVVLAVPPVPVQARVKFVAVVRAPVDWLPLVAFAPLQPPEAVQLLALVELQVSVDAPPLATLVGLAANVTVGAGATVTVTLRSADPPAPVHARVNTVVAARGEVDWLPLVALAPLQPPDAVQLTVFVELHVNVDEPPLAMVVGFAAIVTVGAGGGVPAVTVTDRLVEPPAPVQVSVKIDVADRAPVDSLPPAVLFAPLHASDAAQLVALAVLHVNVEALPTTTVVGFAARVTVGAGGAAPTVTVAVWLADPPAPVQFSVKLVVADNDPVDTLPLVPLAPVQPPEAVQPVAFVELHVSVDAPPLVTDVGLAASVTVGAAEPATVTSTVLLALPPEPEHVSV